MSKNTNYTPEQVAQYITGWLSADSPNTLLGVSSAIHNAMNMLDDHQDGIDAFIERNHERWDSRKHENTETMDRLDFLQWIYERMRHVHKEVPNLDYMRRLQQVICVFREEARSPIRVRELTEGEIIMAGDFWKGAGGMQRYDETPTDGWGVFKRKRRYFKHKYAKIYRVISIQYPT